MRVRFTFDPEKATGVSVPKNSREEALQDVADYVKEQVLSRTGEGRSSVKGGRWKRKLTPEYLKRKKQESGANFANLELGGDLLDAFETGVQGRKVFLAVEGDQAPVAEGNLLGSYGREPDPSKARQFMPIGEQELAPEIMAGVKRILERYQED